jgi:hypothetical protein
MQLLKSDLSHVDLRLCPVSPAEVPAPHSVKPRNGRHSNPLPAAPQRRRLQTLRLSGPLPATLGDGRRTQGRPQRGRGDRPRSPGTSPGRAGGEGARGASRPGPATIRRRPQRGTRGRGRRRTWSRFRAVLISAERCWLPSGRSSSGAELSVGPPGTRATAGGARANSGTDTTKPAISASVRVISSGSAPGRGALRSHAGGRTRTDSGRRSTLADMTTERDASAGAGKPLRWRHPANRHVDRRRRGERIADRVTGVFGSWRFIVVQTVIVTAWIALNLVAVAYRWDPYPFILLNLVLHSGRVGRPTHPAQPEPAGRNRSHHRRARLPRQPVPAATPHRLAPRRPRSGLPVCPSGRIGRRRLARRAVPRLVTPQNCAGVRAAAPGSGSSPSATTRRAAERRQRVAISATCSPPSE